MSKASMFQLKTFVAHSGQLLHWKIECDSLTKKDWFVLASLVAPRYPFGQVIGVERGGRKFAEALAPMRTKSDLTLVVDDVLTTGESILHVMKAVADPPVLGVVAFARGPLPPGVVACFHVGNAIEP